MQYFCGFQYKPISLESNSKIEKSSFAQLRDGCIRISANNLCVSINSCLFLDCSAAGKHGSAIYIAGQNCVSDISKCIGSSCYTVPLNNGALVEGQFAYLISEGEQSDISLRICSIFLCAPFIFRSDNCQRVPMYFRYGCKSVKELNCSRNKAEYISLYVNVIQEKSIELSFITLADCETEDTILRSSQGIQSFSFANFINNTAIKDNIGYSKYEEASVHMIDCCFVFPYPHKSSIVREDTVTLERCFVKNIDTDGAIVVDPKSDAMENPHSGLNTILKEIFGEPMMKRKTNKGKNNAGRHKMLLSFCCTLTATREW